MLHVTRFTPKFFKLLIVSLMQGVCIRIRNTATLTYCDSYIRLTGWTKLGWCQCRAYTYLLRSQRSLPQRLNASTSTFNSHLAKEDDGFMVEHPCEIYLESSPRSPTGTLVPQHRIAGHPWQSESGTKILRFRLMAWTSAFRPLHLVSNTSRSVCHKDRC